MKVFTVNSIYEIDIINRRYRITPNELDDDQAANNLQYAIWHDMVGFNIQKTLVITYPESECGAAKANMPCSNRHRIETGPIIKVEIDGV